MNRPEMHMPRARNEVNVNTIIQVVGFLIVIGGLGVSYGQVTGQIEQQAAVIERHAIQIEVLQGHANRVENLHYRVGMVEQSQTALVRSVEEMKAILNDQRADTRVMREILARLEATLGESREQANR